ncbi:hypothetical protein PORY_002046 [Pneumocystis oryctolagi]|uniref:Uncharacterized protein n=1 Tax=Pneumocystis oryctolagi TaxID=42067 RepID=A0ACB7CCH9_9ASCO|nr:hypothetical protein PORY_002046 [Pneumocystis oryctolagi]
MSNDLENRIKSYNSTIESFISLIPSKYYNGATLKDSWKKRKRTKEEARYLRKLKLNPDLQLDKDNINLETNTEEIDRFKKNNILNNKDKSCNGLEKKGHIENERKALHSTSFSKDPKIQENIKNQINNKHVEKENEELFKNRSNENKDKLFFQENTKTQTQRASNISDLRAKLASRIEQLRASRKALTNTSNSSTENRDSILETRKKREQILRKKKKESMKMKKKHLLQEEQKNNSPNNSLPDNGLVTDKSIESNLLYGRISFASDKEDKLKSKKKKYQSMDLAGALHHAEAKRIRLSKLSEEKRKQIAESDSWKKAFLQGEGKKVKDNEALLKKSMKRQERQKKKSAKAWNERLLQLSKAKQLRQKKREENIETRKAMKRNKHLRKKQRPGFEGSLQGNEHLSTASNLRWDEAAENQRRWSRRSPRYHSRSRSWTPRRSYSPRKSSPSLDNPSSRRRRSRSPLVSPSHRRQYNSRQATRNAMMNHIRESSQQDRRVYIGNLSYDVKWHHLKDFMKQAGEVIFADVLMLPNGMSKGCGVAEYATRDEAQNAINTLSNQTLMGRMVYVREDREQEPRFGGPCPGSSRSYGGYFGDTRGSPHNSLNGRQLFIQNLPYNVGWQDIKDLFRSAGMYSIVLFLRNLSRTGNVIRTDIHLTPDGRPKGTGIVLFETVEEARNAQTTFNGYDWQGRVIEVREDRFANPIGFGRGSRGGYGKGFRGNYSGYGRDGYENSVPFNDFTDGATANGEPSETIYVKNLPWSTSDEDLVELFTTIGKVERAEIQYEPSGRSRGAGVVRFDALITAQTAISKFQGYEYGGRQDYSFTNIITIL